MWFRNIFGANSAHDPAGAVFSTALSPRMLRQLDRLRLNTGPLLPGQPVGSRTSHMRKPASDFREHRQYTPGDDVRYVDWKASARQEHIFIKQGDYQKAAVVYLLVDCSASMTWGDPPKRQAVLALANALGYMALAHNDRLVIAPAAGHPPAHVPGHGGLQHEPRSQNDLRLMGPFWGKGQAPRLNELFQALRFEGQVDLALALAGLRQRKLSRGGLVLVLSDMLGAHDMPGTGSRGSQDSRGALNLPAALDSFPAPDWNVVFCHLLHPAEIDPDLNGFFEMQDIETGQKKLYPVTPKVLETYRQRLQAWREEIAQICMERGARYTMIPTNSSFDNDILPQLLRAQVVKRL